MRTSTLLGLLVAVGCSSSPVSTNRDSAGAGGGAGGSADSGSDGAAVEGGSGGGAANHGSGGGSVTGGSGGAPRGGSGGTPSGGSGGAPSGGSGGTVAGAGGGGAARGGSGGAPSGGSGGTVAGAGGGGSGGAAQGGASGADIGTWTDSPGTCPGMPSFDVTTLADLQDATRGEGKHTSDPASACYLIHNGTYTQSGSTVPMLLNRGGTSSTARRLFIGQSRAGVKIMGRATIADGVSHIQLSNLTYDISGVSDTGSYNTLSLGTGTDLRVDHVTFTADCAHGANGGHIETNGTDDLVVEACLIENFGRCGASGHQDHGVYLASGSNLVLRNNEIRGNASRGIQLYTAQGAYGTLDAITIESNRIHDNGHADYEDGIVLNGGGTGNITNVTIQHNLVYGNYYSGIRQVDVGYTAVTIQKNTFYANGGRSTGALRSEMNIDSSGSGANTTVTKNILQPGYAVLDNCYDAATRNFRLIDNVVQGTVPSGTAGNCISQSVAQAPMFVNAAAADFRTMNAAVSGYGAYAP